MSSVSDGMTVNDSPILPAYWQIDVDAKIAAAAQPGDAKGALPAEHKV